MKNFNIHEWQAKYLREDSSTKQTAVEWLLNQLYTRIPNIEWSNYEDDIEQAKEMEKQQIEIAFDSGWTRADNTKDNPDLTAEDYGKTYYNSNYR